MGESLTVRRIAADQGAVLRELRTASLRDAPHAFGETLEETLAEHLSTFEETAVRHAASRDIASFILYTEGHPAGLVYAHFEHASGHRAFVSALWVAPPVRHLRGGELLVNTACQWLASEQATRVYAWVTDTNVTARRFYERLGFTASGDRMRSPFAPDQWESLLVRELAESTQG